ncbi:hypothetical protein Tco_0200205 [Tanacetum coccineum]
MEGHGTKEVTINRTQIFNNPVAFKAPKTSSKDEKKVPQGKHRGAKSGRRKQIPVLMNHPQSKIDAANNVYSSKGDIGSTTGYSKKKKKSSSAKDSNPSQPPASTPMVAGLHKEAQQKTGSPTSLGVTNKERANPQLTSVVSVSITKPIFLASTIIHSKSASGQDASAASTAEVDPEQSAPSDSVSKQQDDEFNTSPDLSISNDATKEIKGSIQAGQIVDFIDLDSCDEPIIVQDGDEEEAYTEEVHDKEVHAEQYIKPAGASVPDPPSPKSIKIQELIAETEAAILKAQPSFLNVEKLTELLVQSLKHELSKLLTYHDFSNSLPSELKELPFKFKDIIGEIRELKRYVEGLEIEIPGDLKALPGKLELFQSSLSRKISSIQAQMSKLKILDALPSLLNSVTKALDSFAQAIEYASHKAGDQTAQDDAKANLNSQPIPTTSPVITIIIPPTTSPIIIPSTVQLQSPFLSSPPKTSSQSEGEPIKNKGKEAMSHKETEEKVSETEFDPVVKLTGFMVKSSKKKKLKQFNFVTKKGDNIHLTKEQIKEQKRIEEPVKADMAKKEEVVGKEDVVDLLGINVVTSVYKAKIKYDKYVIRC